MGLDGVRPWPIETVDAQFLQPFEHRPSPDPQVELQHLIPPIDLSPLHDESLGSRKKIVQEIGAAAEKWGFFQVINHGISPQLMQDLEKKAKEFFCLPLEVKRTVRRTFENPMGYFDTELTKNVRDWKEVFDFYSGGSVELPSLDGSSTIVENQWPLKPLGFRDACKKYTEAVEKLASELLELLAQSLELPSKSFCEFFVNHSTRVRLNYYPKCPSPDLVLGVSRHKDGCALTVLGQDQVGGLQVRRWDGEWIPVKPRLGAFAVNVGDLIQVWSNGKYKSVEHRVVVNSRNERFSCPVFVSPSYSTIVSPMPALLDAQHPPKYRGLNWGEYFRMRRDSNFKNLGKANVQLDHWALEVESEVY